MTDLAQEDMDRTQREREAAADEALGAQHENADAEDGDEGEGALPEQ